MPGFVRVVLLFSLISPAAADSIYLCKADDGSAVYRDFPCPPDWNSTVVAEPGKNDGKGAAQTRGAGQAPASAPRELQAGMSKAEVREILGNPSQITQEEGVDGRVDTWQYGKSETLQFDAGGHLVK